jgi:hypothetical protein
MEFSIELRKKKETKNKYETDVITDVFKQEYATLIVRNLQQNSKAVNVCFV